MINPRTLELLKTPELFSGNDLSLLESEIQKFPYIQSVRALYLYGVHQFDSENYQKELSKTAAYTTDKKILYQFINKNKIQEELQIKDISNSEKPSEVSFAGNAENIQSSSSIYNEENLREYEAPKPVYINGELNRILFEGEESTFTEDAFKKIDLEATKESGILVTEKENIIEISSEDNIPELTESSENHFNKEEKTALRDDQEINFHQFDEFAPGIKVEKSTSDTEIVDSEDSENFSREEVVNEENISSEKQEIESNSELSFHGTGAFMPEIQMKANVRQENYEVPKPQLSRHDAEMQRLIAEVEAKMKANKKPKVETAEEELPQNHDINFAENHNFSEKESGIQEQHVESFDLESKISENIPAENQQKAEAEQVNNVKIDDTPDSSWKPMNFEPVIPDSVINKKEKKNPENEVVSSEKRIPETSNTGNERPVFNVSFLSDIAAITPKPEDLAKEQDVQKNDLQSNVPQFINTWQNWLKIDRDPVSSKKSTEDIKNKAIEKFIETEPKISQLKEESSYTIKEKSGDISHLMTETLANLYITQKLYTKAIKAFDALKQKHPEKIFYFDSRIEEIKKMKN